MAVRAINKVTVHWVDSYGSGGWRYPEEYQNLPEKIMESTGYLLQKTKDYLVIVQSLGYPFVSDSIQIPRSSVKSMEVLGHTKFGNP